MDKKNAFENVNINAKDKYLKRHQDALKLEKVKAIDKRIADFDAKRHNLEWAKEAIDFCNREELNGKEPKEQRIAELKKKLEEAKGFFAKNDIRNEIETQIREYYGVGNKKK